MSRRTFLPRTTRVIVFIIRPLLMLLTKRDWQGAEKLPKSGGYVLAPNHISHVDPFLISHFMVDHGVTPRFLAKDTLMTAPVVGAILRSAEQIPVRRRTANAKDSLGPAEAAVRDGLVVTIYPEGTITRDPAAWPMSGYTGAVRVALATGAPLVPLMQWGPQEILWPYTQEATPAAPQDDPHPGGRPDRPVRPRGPGAEREGAAHRHRPAHGHA